MLHRLSTTKRLFFIVLLACLFGFTQRTDCQYISDSAKVYLVTLSPGDEIYSYFGHSVIRVSYPKYGVDITYGYGTFDFNTPHFYEQFIFGRLLYSLSVDRFEEFMQAAKTEGQAVYQQALHLTNAEKYQMMLNLQENYKPENRWYRYDFLYDNCATRIRDMIEKSLDGTVRYDSSFIKHKVTFRDMLLKSLENEPWVALGINTMLGPGSDKKVTVESYMFLPDYLMEVMCHASVTKGKTTRILADKPVLLLKETLQIPHPNPLTLPGTFFAIFFLLVVGISYWSYRNKKYSSGFDVFLFLITGLLGIVFLTIWIGSLHKVMAGNINLLWANPLNLVLAILIVIRRKTSHAIRRLVPFYFLFYSIYIPLSFTITHHFFLVPLILDLMLFIRLGMLYKWGQRFQLH